jgi:hypothetical protein
MFDHRVHTARSMLALACVLAIAACGGVTAPQAAPSGPTPGSSQAVTPTQAQGPTAPPGTSRPATITGLVMLIYSTGAFRLSDGKSQYTVDMTLTTSVINLRGREVPRQFIQVAGSVTVTGSLSGSTITAEVVAIPTNKDAP